MTHKRKKIEMFTNAMLHLILATVLSLLFVQSLSDVVKTEESEKPDNSNKTSPPGNLFAKPAILKKISAPKF